MGPIWCLIDTSPPTERDTMTTHTTTVSLPACYVDAALAADDDRFAPVGALYIAWYDAYIDAIEEAMSASCPLPVTAYVTFGPLFDGLPGQGIHLTPREVLDLDLTWDSRYSEGASCHAELVDAYLACVLANSGDVIGAWITLQRITECALCLAATTDGLVCRDCADYYDADVREEKANA